MMQHLKQIVCFNDIHLELCLSYPILLNDTKITHIGSIFKQNDISITLRLFNTLTKRYA